MDSSMLIVAPLGRKTVKIDTVPGRAEAGNRSPHVRWDRKALVHLCIYA